MLMHSVASSIMSSLLIGNLDPTGGRSNCFYFSKVAKKILQRASWGFLITVIWFLKPGPSFFGSSYSLSMEIYLTSIEKSSTYGSPPW